MQRLPSVLVLKVIAMHALHYMFSNGQSSKNVGEVRSILLVDDSKLQRKILSSLVKRWGFKVLEAESGEQALEICKTEQPDIVLSDWMMPGMSGLELCRSFRNLPNDDYGYFIILTSKGEKDEVAEGLRAGADDFLTKPINADELRARISAGERILDMQGELTYKNCMIIETLDELQRVYDSLDKDLIEGEKITGFIDPRKA
jgi:sigma-B regulation protein RsbU (phosphoserine phosphatase)